MCIAPIDLGVINVSKIFYITSIYKINKCNSLSSEIEILRDNLLDIRNKARNGNLLGFYIKAIGNNSLLVETKAPAKNLS